MKDMSLVSKAVDQTQETKERASMLEKYVNDWTVANSKIDRRHHISGYRESKLMGANKMVFLPTGTDPSGMSPDILVKNILDPSQKHRDRFLGELTKKFMKTAERGNARILAEYFNLGFPVNFEDPETNETALHLVAASGAKQAMHVILQYDDCDYLHKDKAGLLPSQKAFRLANDPVITRLLVQKEKRQAEKQDMQLSYKYGNVQIIPKASS